MILEIPQDYAAAHEEATKDFRINAGRIGLYRQQTRQTDSLYKYCTAASLNGYLEASLCVTSRPTNVSLYGIEFWSVVTIKSRTAVQDI
jgi:hypothetical protein